MLKKDKLFNQIFGFKNVSLSIFATLVIKNES